MITWDVLDITMIYQHLKYDISWRLNKSNYISGGIVHMNTPFLEYINPLTAKLFNLTFHPL